VRAAPAHSAVDRGATPIRRGEREHPEQLCKTIRHARMHNLVMHSPNVRRPVEGADLPEPHVHGRSPRHARGERVMRVPRTGSSAH